jgi:hypothetical protein
VVQFIIFMLLGANDFAPTSLSSSKPRPDGEPTSRSDQESTVIYFVNSSSTKVDDLVRVFMTNRNQEAVGGVKRLLVHQ